MNIRITTLSGPVMVEFLSCHMFSYIGVSVWENSGSTWMKLFTNLMQKKEVGLSFLMFSMRYLFCLCFLFGIVSVTMCEIIIVKFRVLMMEYLSSDIRKFSILKVMINLCFSNHVNTLCTVNMIETTILTKHSNCRN